MCEREGMTGAEGSNKGWREVKNERREKGRKGRESERRMMKKEGIEGGKMKEKR
jgi:hypothetical protein